MQKEAGCLWLSPVALACNPSYSGTDIRRIEVQSQPTEIVPEDPILKIYNTKKGWWSGSSGRVPA
jgi:hypothetical protein